MPFAYLGAKHGLARKYPPPAFGTIIEPFAGSAGYSVFYATRSTRVILVEKDPAIVRLWRQLQTEPLAVIAEADGDLARDRTRSQLLAFIGGSGSRVDKECKVTTLMRRNYRQVRTRVLHVVPYLKDWQVIEGDYRDAPDIPATWFIDPPYQPHQTLAGDGYREGATGLDYEALGGWCRARRGQVIVCEQEPAAWLPFRPLARQKAQSTSPTTEQDRMRVEVVWSRTPGRMTGTEARTAARATAVERRSSIRSG